MKSQHNKTKNTCEECGSNFSTQVQLENHIELQHGSKKRFEKQYNCKDCPFQGENGLELKRHIQRTKHTPCDHPEHCYTCKKEFASYWHLMNHRKIEHPSNNICRYFLKQECDFDSETCWYLHKEKPINEEKKSEMKFVCNNCEREFEDRSVLMKHKKVMHPEKVSNCKSFAQGKCNAVSDSCWYIHSECK